MDTIKPHLILEILLCLFDSLFSPHQLTSNSGLCRSGLRKLAVRMRLGRGREQLASKVEKQYGSLAPFSIH